MTVAFVLCFLFFVLCSPISRVRVLPQNATLENVCFRFLSQNSKTILFNYLRLRLIYAKKNQHAAGWIYFVFLLFLFAPEMLSALYFTLEMEIVCSVIYIYMQFNCVQRSGIAGCRRNMKICALPNLRLCIYVARIISNTSVHE